MGLHADCARASVHDAPTEEEMQIAREELQREQRGGGGTVTTTRADPARQPVRGRSSPSPQGRKNNLGRFGRRAAVADVWQRASVGQMRVSQHHFIRVRVLPFLACALWGEQYRSRARARSAVGALVVTRGGHHFGEREQRGTRPFDCSWVFFLIAVVAHLSTLRCSQRCSVGWEHRQAIGANACGVFWTVAAHREHVQGKSVSSGESKHVPRKVRQHPRYRISANARARRRRVVRRCASRPCPTTSFRSLLFPKDWRVCGPLCPTIRSV